MSITLEDVRYAAKLGALQLGEEELHQRAKELAEILSYVDKLSSLSTRGIPPTSHVHGVVNFFRDDIVSESLPLDELKKIAPDFKNDFFRVPKIL